MALCVVPDNASSPGSPLSTWGAEIKMDLDSRVCGDEKTGILRGLNSYDSCAQQGVMRWLKLGFLDPETDELLYGVTWT